VTSTLAAGPSPTAATDSTRRWVALAIVLSATFMQLLDVSIVNVATRSIQSTLHSSYADVQLVLSGYQLGFASTLITAARLGDVYGRKRLFLLGMFLFTGSSALCGVAVNPGMLVASRVVQGIASGLMFPQVLSVIQVLFPPAERGRAFSAFGATLGLGTILGPVTGGLLIQADLFTDPWRAIFFVNVPIGVVAFTSALRLLPESTAPDRPRLDVTGAVLSAVGLALLVYPLAEGRTRGWPLWIDVMIAVAVLLLAAFVTYERRLLRGDGSPVLDTRLFADRSFRMGSLLNLIFFAGVPAFFFTFSLYLQQGDGFSALGAGLSSFPFAVASAIASARSDVVARRLGRSTLALGAGLLAVGMAGLILTVHLVGVRPHAYLFIPAMLVCGVGFGLFVAPVITIILAGVQRERAGAASGALSTTQQVGGALGVALIGVVFFGLVGSNAATAASRAIAPTRAGTPPAAVATFERCFVERSKAKDPTVTPPGCNLPASAGSSATLARAGAQASARTFTTTIQETLLFEVAVFGLTALLVLRLPQMALSGGRGAAEGGTGDGGTDDGGTGEGTRRSPAHA